MKRKVTIHILFAVTVAAFLMRYLSKALSAEHPLLLADVYYYFQQALHLYINPNLEALTNSERPIFSWLAVLTLRVFQVPLDVQTLSLLNTLYAWLVLFLGIMLWSPKPKIRESLYWITGLLIASGTFVNFSDYFLGEIAVTGWMVLVTGTLLKWQHQEDRSLKWVLLSAVVFVMGLHSKPIFLFWFGLVFAAMRLRKFLDGKIERKEVVVFLATAASLGFLLVPRQLAHLIGYIYHLNEVMHYSVKYQGALNSWLWIPNLFLMSIPVLFLIITCGALAASFDWGRLKYEWTKGRFAAVWWAWGAAALFSSFAIKAKDERTFLFLVVLFFILIALTTERIEPHLTEKRRRLIRVSQVLILAFCCLLQFSFFRTQTWLAGVVSLSEGRMAPVYSSLDDRGSVEQHGYDEVLRKIVSDIKLHPPADGREADIYLPILNYRNIFWGFSPSILESVQYEMCDFSPGATRAPCLNHPHLSVKTSVFRNGDWNNAGGVPKAFFNSRYIVVVEDKAEPPAISYKERQDLYNVVVTRLLLKKNAAALDGLVEVSQVQNRLGDVWTIYRRRSLPSAKNFVSLVDIFEKEDPGNPWNKPFLETRAAIFSGGKTSNQGLFKN